MYILKIAVFAHFCRNSALLQRKVFVSWVFSIRRRDAVVTLALRTLAYFKPTIHMKYLGRMVGCVGLVVDKRG